MHAAIKEALKQRNIAFEQNVSTASLSTFRIGGTAALLIAPRCCGELAEAVSICRKQGAPYFLLGAGSNLLFPDGGLKTVLIRTTGLDAMRLTASGLYADCGVRLGALAAKAAQCGLSGLEFAAGIPGTLGGAIFMNAGANGREMADVISEIDVYDPKANRFLAIKQRDAAFAYRNSRFQNENLIILGAWLSLSCAEPLQVRRRTCELLQARREKQPTKPSAGSAFRRPAGDVALSRIIDELGLKGLSVGGAAVSRKHAGFIVNNGSATASDVRALIAAIQNIIENEKGFRPIPEIRFVEDEK